MRLEGPGRQALTAVQIHAAHGYLLSQFLSPIFNRRLDEYGGSLVNRARILLEIYKATREVVGDNFPVLIKINCRDFSENGLSLEDSVQAAVFWPMPAWMQLR